MVAPSLQEIPLENNTDALDFAKDLMAGTIDLLILLTGVGTRTLVNVWETQFSLEAIRQALTKTTLVCRGPKPIAALKELGVPPHVTVSEPNTWRDILDALDTFKPEGALRTPDCHSGIRCAQRGSCAGPDRTRRQRPERIRLPMGPSDDVTALERTLRNLVDGTVSVVLFTSAAQVDHIVKLLGTADALATLRDALGTTMVASIGPMTSQRLREHQFPVDFEPSHTKMGILVKEASEHAAEVLHSKRPSMIPLRQPSPAQGFTSLFLT